jgi:hypothetical protein
MQELRVVHKPLLNLMFFDEDFVVQQVFVMEQDC